MPLSSDSLTNTNPVQSGSALNMPLSEGSNFRFSSLGSGSRGNATLVEAISFTGGEPVITRVLVDCGFGPRELKRRLARLNVQPEMIDAVLITHEHSDHIGGVASGQRKYGWNVYLTAGTARGINANLSSFTHSKFHLIPPDYQFTIRHIAITAFTVPHDAREPCQFTLEFSGQKLGVLSDLGRITEHVVEHLHDCDALLLECNHDVPMLNAGAYPYMLKRRVAGDYGHLSNEQAAGLVHALHDRASPVQLLALAHLSEQNNSPDLAIAAIQTALEDWSTPPTVVLTNQADGCPWLPIAGTKLLEHTTNQTTNVTPNPISMETAA